MRRAFWTLHPRYRALEGVCKTLAALSLPFATWALILVSPGAHSGPSSGWLIAGPILLTASLWKTSEKWTRRRPYFRPSILWGLVFAGLGVFALSIDPLIGLGLLLAAWSSVSLCRFGADWKRWRIESGPLDA